MRKVCEVMTKLADEMRIKLRGDVDVVAVISVVAAGEVVTMSVGDVHAHVADKQCCCCY